MAQALTFLREQRQKLTEKFDENPNDQVALGHLNTINQKIQEVLRMQERPVGSFQLPKDLADQKKVPSLKQSLLQQELDFLADRKSSTSHLLMVKLGVRYWAIQLVMLYSNVYPVNPLSDPPMINSVSGSAEKALCAFTEFMVPKQLAEDLALAYPNYFNLL